MKPEPPKSRRPGLIRMPGPLLMKLPVITDIRGSLLVGDFKSLPFKPKRLFAVFDIPSKNTRGQHAHKKQHQFMICMRGSCSILLDNGKHKDEVRMFAPNVGLYVPPMIWALQHRHSEDSLLVVLSSGSYDPDDYIRDYERFLRAVRNR